MQKQWKYFYNSTIASPELKIIFGILEGYIFLIKLFSGLSILC